MNKVLGELISQKDFPEILVGQVENEYYNVSVEIDSDDGSIESATLLAEKIISSLEEFDLIARKIINRDLLDVYNAGCNNYDQEKAGGRRKAIWKPKLSPDEFQKYFTLISVGICGDSCVDILYDTKNLFPDHSVYVTSFEGIDFGCARAQLFDLAGNE